MFNIPIYNKRLWMSNVIIAAGLLATFFFPTESGTQAMIAGFGFLVVLPLLYTRFFLREKLSFLGVSWGDVTRGSIWLGLFLAAFAGSLFAVARYTSLLSRFSVPVSVRESFLMLLVYIALVGIYVFLFEFFFRGFVMAVWTKAFGPKSIIMQAVLSSVFALVSSHGKVDLSFVVVFVMAICSGFIAFVSRSVWYPFFFSYISAILGIVMVLVFVK